MFNIYRKSKKYFYLFFPTFSLHANKYRSIIKFVISGSIATLADLVLLYSLTDILGIWYLFSSSIAFLVSSSISFCLQKFWTFRDNDLEKIHKQAYLYLFIGLTNLSINAGAMYLLVEKLEIWYLLAQIIVDSILGISSFLVYRFVIFRKKL